MCLACRMKLSCTLSVPAANQERILKQEHPGMKALKLFSGSRQSQQPRLIQKLELQITQATPSSKSFFYSSF
jgi:hypothetical protein